jgi:hypothetical protein
MLKTRKTRRLHGNEAFSKLGNDPSAGSPTETLLRLLPGSSHCDKGGFHQRISTPKGFETAVPAFLETAQSRAATGGVYKGQGRNQRELMTHTYWEFLVQGK